MKNKPYFTKLVNQVEKIEEDVSVLVAKKKLLLSKMQDHCIHPVLIESGGYDISSYDNQFAYAKYRVHCDACGIVWFTDSPDWYDIKRRAVYWKNIKEINSRFAYLLDRSF